MGSDRTAGPSGVAKAESYTCTRCSHSAFGSCVKRIFFGWDRVGFRERLIPKTGSGFRGLVPQKVANLGFCARQNRAISRRWCRHLIDGMEDSVLNTEQQVKTIWHLGGMKPVALGKRVWSEIDHDNVLTHAAALAYNYLGSLFPLLLFLT